MSKRFTDTNKWKKPFIRTMKAPYKLLWLYILDECDHAGIWQIDMEVAEIKIGERLKLDEALRQFGTRVIFLEDKLFIPDFIQFQYGDLNPSNRVHNSVINILQSFNLLDENYKTKELISPLQGVKDKEKEKDKDKDKEKDKEPKVKKEHLFSESDFYDFEKFKLEFIGTDYEKADLKFYYESVKNWSASKGAKKLDWIATTRNFILRDKQDNKLNHGTTQQTTTRLGENDHTGKQYKL